MLALQVDSSCSAYYSVAHVAREQHSCLHSPLVSLTLRCALSCTCSAVSRFWPASQGRAVQQCSHWHYLRNLGGAVWHPELGYAASGRPFCAHSRPLVPEQRAGGHLQHLHV